MAKDFDPSEKTVEEVEKHLEKADDDERQRVLNAELSGKKRKTILEAHGVDPDERRDASGRVMYPWEPEPEEGAADSYRNRKEDPAEESVAAAATRSEQGGVTPAGSGSAAGGVAGTGAGTTAPGATAATTAAGAPGAAGATPGTTTGGAGVA